MSAEFRMIRPIALTDAIITANNVIETAPALYAGGTTYGAGVWVHRVVSNGELLVYRSLQAGNTGNTPESSPLWWKYESSTYAAYSSGTTYAALFRVIDPANHLIYESKVSGNTGNALTDTTKWLLVGATNARAMFDETYGSQTSRSEQIIFQLTPGQLVNAMFLGNLDASSVTLQQSDSGWSKTVNLNSHPVLDWYSFWYEPIVRQRDLPVVDIPPYPASTLTVTVDNPGGIAALGLCVTGQSVMLGYTQWDVLGGIISYSGTTTDTFGRTTFLRRTNVKKLNLDVRILPGFETEAHRLLSLYTDEPMVFIGSTDYGMATAYGYLGSWQIPISLNKTAPIEIKGLA